LAIKDDEVYVRSGIITTPLGGDSAVFINRICPHLVGYTEIINYQTSRGLRNFAIKATVLSAGQSYRLCRLSDRGVPLVTTETPIPTTLPDIYQLDVSSSAEEAVGRWSNQVRKLIDPIGITEVKG